MKILGIDTSFIKNFSVGFLNNEKIVEMNFFDFDTTDEYITFAIDSIVKTLNFDLKEVDYFTVGVGPGSFTGLRIGVTIIKTLAWAGKKNVIPLSSLELIANSLKTELFSEKILIVPVIDARTGKVFSAAFDVEKRLLDDVDILPEDLVNLIESFSSEYKKVIFLGDGSSKYKEVFEKIDFPEKIFLANVNIKGSVICKTACKKLSFPENIISPDKVKPNYLRKSEAELKMGL